MHPKTKSSLALLQFFLQNKTANEVFFRGIFAAVYKKKMIQPKKLICLVLRKAF